MPELFPLGSRAHESRSKLDGSYRYAMEWGTSRCRWRHESRRSHRDPAPFSGRASNPCMRSPYWTGVFIKVREYSLGDHWIFDAGDDLDGAAAGSVRAGPRWLLPRQVGNSTI